MNLALLNLHPVLVSKSWRSLLEFLGFTGAMALMSGLGFALALRSQANLSNSTPSPFHSEQNFPPRADWPIPAQSSGGTAENPDQTRYNSLQNQP
jgi:hypothetical protein